MRKLLILALMIALPVNASSYIDQQLKEVKHNKRYNSAKTHQKMYSVQKAAVVKAKDIKDPELIKLSSFKEIKEEDFQAKLKEDEKEYSKIAKSFNTESVGNSSGVDYYNVYRISERLIRANNLDYVNWRISIRKSEDVNADSSSANYIRIFTPLYDSLYHNDDALAFVIAHEMAHLILGHSQRLLEYSYTIQKLNRVSRTDTTGIGDLYSSVHTAQIFKNLRMMEYVADAEALNMLVKAGYSSSKAIEALNFLSALGEINNIYNSHPLSRKRIESYNENVSILDPDLDKVGRENIYNGKVLKCRKSSDRVSVIIEKSEVEKQFYQVETIEQRLTRVAYLKYKAGKMEDAIKYFEKLNSINENYISYLYISYANEYLYEKLKKQKYMDKALDAIEKAYELNPDSEYVQKQQKELAI